MELPRIELGCASLQGKALSQQTAPRRQQVASESNAVLRIWNPFGHHGPRPRRAPLPRRLALRTGIEPVSFRSTGGRPHQRAYAAKIKKTDWSGSTGSVRSRSRRQESNLLDRVPKTRASPIGYSSVGGSSGNRTRLSGASTRRIHHDCYRPANEKRVVRVSIPLRLGENQAS